MRKIFFNIIKIIRKFFYWLWNQEGSPSQRAVGFGLGIFSGCFPFFGFQTLLGIFLAKLLKANTLLAAVGTWISNPFTYVPLYWLNYRIGSILLTPNNNIVDLSHITTNKLWSQGWNISFRLIIGSSVVGMISGLIAGVCLYLLFKKASTQ